MTKFTIIEKKNLKDGYYYSGFIHQHYTVRTGDHKFIAMWDSKSNLFWMWEFEGNLKIKRSIQYIIDINNEIEYGFYPVKETIPLDKDIFD